MVYERLGPSNKHVHLNADDTSPCPVILIHRSTSAAILRTCKTIHQEASAIVLDIASKFYPKYAVQIVLALGAEKAEDMMVRFLVAIGKQLKQWWRDETPCDGVENE